MPEKITHPANSEPFAFAVDLRARALNYWLQNSLCFVHNDEGLTVNVSREGRGMKPDNNDRVSKKKAYNRPQLQVYGDLRQITNAVTFSAAALDGGGYPNSRTH